MTIKTGLSSSASVSNPNRLKRTLGSGFAVAAGVGTVIGLGVMRTPGEIAAVFPEPMIYVGLWLVVGLFVLLNILVAAELVGMTPRSGGYYVLIKHALGPYPGFLMGWIDWLSFLGTIALKSVVMTEYIILLIPALDSWNKVIAISITSLFAGLQMRGVALGSKIHQIAAFIMCLILVGVSLALLLGEPAANAATSVDFSQPGLKEYGLVLAAIVFTYDGWLTAAYFGGEIKGGGGAVAKACIRGVLVILVLYVFLNAVLAFTVPLDQLAGSELALAKALDITWGEGAGTLVIVAAVFILLAHQNMNYMSGPRCLYALSVDGLGIGKAASVHKYGNPLIAVLLTWLGSVALILVGGFEFLLNLATLFFVVLYVAVMAGVMILRRTEPETPRPYLAWAHPYSTWFCISVWLLITGFTAFTAPQSAISAIIMTSISIPVYLLLSRKRAKK
jgi:APA family basic amino acid/polyamine antiporter